MKNQFKITWGVDLLDQGKGSEKVVEWITQLASKTSVEVEPVYVFSSSLLGFSSLLAGQISDDHRQEVKNKFQEYLKKTGAKTSEGRVVFHLGSTSKTEAAELLDGEAKRWGADLVVVSSHGRKAINRLLMGSFAETLLLKSTHPVLVLGPECKPGKLKKILFPTDFSGNFKKCFETCLSFSKAVGAEVHAVSVVENPVDPIFQAGVTALGGGWVNLMEDPDDKIKELQTKLVDLQKQAATQGVTFHSKVLTHSLSITDTLIEHMEKQNMDMVIMQSHSSGVEAAIVGSLARQLVRYAPCPTMVIRG